MVASLAHLATVSPAGALRRDAFSVVVTTSHRSSSGLTTVALAGTVTSRPPVLLLRKVTARSSGSTGRLCSPGPVSTYAVPSSHTCHAGQARSPGMLIHRIPDFLPASERRAFRSVTP